MWSFMELSLQRENADLHMAFEFFAQTLWVLVNVSLIASEFTLWMLTDQMLG